MKIINYINIAFRILVLLPSIQSTAMKRETPPTQVPAQAAAPIFDIPGTLAQIRENAVEEKLTNYLEMLPGELQAQIIEIINDEILGILPTEIRPEIREYLNGRVWVDLSKQDKFHLLKKIFASLHTLSKLRENYKEYKHKVLTIASYLFSLKDFQKVANDPEDMKLISRIIQNRGIPDSVYQIGAFLHTPGSIDYLRNELVPQYENLTKYAAENEVRNRKFSMQVEFAQVVREPYIGSWDASLKIVDSFLKAGVSPNFTIEQTGIGPAPRTLLMYAIENRAPYEIIKLLIDKGANVNARQPYIGGTPLSIAQETEGLDPRIIDLLLQKGATIEGAEGQ